MVTSPEPADEPAAGVAGWHLHQNTKIRAALPDLVEALRAVTAASEPCWPLLYLFGEGLFVLATVTLHDDTRITVRVRQGPNDGLAERLAPLALVRRRSIAAWLAREAWYRGLPRRQKSRAIDIANHSAVLPKLIAAVRPATGCEIVAWLASHPLEALDLRGVHGRRDGLNLCAEDSHARRAARGHSAATSSPASSVATAPPRV